MTEPQPLHLSILVERVSAFVLVNLLWLLFAVPLITLPLATAGLFAVITPWVRGKHSELFQVFFGAMWQYAGKSLAICLGNGVAVILVATNSYTFTQMDMSQPIALLSLNVTILAALMVLLMNVYLWVLLVTVNLPLTQLIRAAFKMVILHPTWSCGVGLLALLPWLGLVILPRGIAILVIPAAWAGLTSWGAWQVLRQYIVDDQFIQGF